MLKAAGGDLGGLRDVIPNAATRRLIFERCAMFSYGKSAGMKALLALMIAFVPVLMVLMAFSELGDQVPMKVNAAGEVLRYGSKGELLFLPVMGFMISAATVAMGLKQARKYGSHHLYPRRPQRHRPGRGVRRRDGHPAVRSALRARYRVLAKTVFPAIRHCHILRCKGRLGSFCVPGRPCFCVRIFSQDGDKTLQAAEICHLAVYIVVKPATILT